jgi:hypothetical protein
LSDSSPNFFSRALNKSVCLPTVEMLTTNCYANFGQHRPWQYLPETKTSRILTPPDSPADSHNMFARALDLKFRMCPKGFKRFTAPASFRERSTNHVVCQQPSKAVRSLLSNLPTSHNSAELNGPCLFNMDYVNEERTRQNNDDQALGLLKGRTRCRNIPTAWKQALVAELVAEPALRRPGQFSAAENIKRRLDPNGGHRCQCHCPHCEWL